MLVAMPKVMECAVCRRRFLSSTYEMAAHVEECRKALYTAHDAGMKTTAVMVANKTTNTMTMLSTTTP